jgi:YfiH family protein
VNAALAIARDVAPPEARQGALVWDRRAGAWRVRFVGRGATWAPGEPPRGAWRAPRGALAWVSQCHGADVVPARPGDCGVADGLDLDRADVAALVVTADCVPVAVVADARAGLVHAGWRGIAAGLPGLAARRLSESGDEPPREAWIGPAIGPCCYEVGEEVARAVAAASGESCVIRRPGAAPRLDLRAAVAAQLSAAGVARIQVLDHCTRCRPEWLWSYRRDGAGAGRNLTLIWRDAAD